MFLKRFTIMTIKKNVENGFKWSADISGQRALPLAKTIDIISAYILSNCEQLPTAQLLQ